MPQSRELLKLRRYNIQDTFLWSSSIVSKLHILGPPGPPSKTQGKGVMAVTTSLLKTRW